MSVVLQTCYYNSQFYTHINVKGYKILKILIFQLQYKTANSFILILVIPDVKISQQGSKFFVLFMLPLPALYSFSYYSVSGVTFGPV
jgi:hypothetical protein